MFTVLSFLQTHLAFSIQASSLDSTVLVSKERGDKRQALIKPNVVHMYIDMLSYEP